MKFALAFVALMIAAPAFANDGGIAAIKVSEIKMREYNDQGKEVKRISNPNFRITLKGGEAKKLQQILPSTVSVVTAMQPELKKAYDETFKELGIYSTESQGVKGKTISISCADGVLKADPKDNSKMMIVKSKESECSITIMGSSSDESVADYFGDMQTFAPKCSN